MCHFQSSQALWSQHEIQASISSLPLSRVLRKCWVGFFFCFVLAPQFPWQPQAHECAVNAGHAVISEEQSTAPVPCLFAVVCERCFTCLCCLSLWFGSRCFVLCLPAFSLRFLHISLAAVESFWHTLTTCSFSLTEFSATLKLLCLLGGCEWPLDSASSLI